MPYLDNRLWGHLLVTIAITTFAALKTVNINLNVLFLPVLTMSLSAAVTFILLLLLLPFRDVKRIGISLIGHQRRIISSIQSLRLQFHHIQQSGFQV